MNFLEEINQLQANMGTNEDEPRNETPDLRVGKKNNNVTLRILPSADPNNQMGFAKLFRTVFFPTPRTKQDGSPLNAVWTLPINPVEGQRADDLIARWGQEGKLVGRYGVITPSVRAMVNALVLDPQNNPIIDMSTGQPKVHAVELPYSVYKEIVTKLSDPRMVTEATPQGFIGADAAYPVTIKQGSDNKYSTEVYLNAPLPPLNGGQAWVSQYAHDFEKYTQPSEVLAPRFFQFIVDAMDGVAPAQPQTQTQAQAPMAPQGQPEMQAPMQNTFAQAPAQPQPPMQQAPAAPVAPQGYAPTPVQQTPVAPVPAAPAQNTFASQANVADQMTAPAAPVAPAQPAAQSNDDGFLADMANQLGL